MANDFHDINCFRAKHMANGFPVYTQQVFIEVEPERLILSTTDSDQSSRLKPSGLLDHLVGCWSGYVL
jgi:hypothetical protein